jgi:SAM-dependent methyltransferase
MNCRFCNNPLTNTFIDLVNSPASNSFLTFEQLNEPETFFPLKVFTCDKCFLVQIDEYKQSEAIFNGDYVYFSSFSTSWLTHVKNYVELMTNRFGLNKDSQVIEIASNDGYLLQYFVEKNIPVLGIEPTENTAKVAIEKGVNTITRFFGTELANELSKSGTKADLFLGNNVLAHVPDIVDIVKGIKIILKPNGVVTIEFPHLMQLVDNNQFDTIYHEHFSYLSFYSVKQIFEAQGLEMFDVEEIPTHGGSLRIYAKHKEDGSKIISENVAQLINKEIAKGINTLTYYEDFGQKVSKVKLDFLDFLIQQKRNNKKVAGYGAAAKGNTLLNYCGVKNDMIDFVVDRNPAKQNMFLPASHIPVFAEAALKVNKPDYIIIFPWNLKVEVIEQLSYAREWGAKFVIPIPHLEII